MTSRLPIFKAGAPLVAQAPLRTCEACVVLPARDESARMEKCLLALLNQSDGRGVAIDPERYEVVVLANNCRDDTAELARSFGRQHPQFILHVLEVSLPPEKSFVGCARKLLMDEACRRLILLGRPNGIIASTDGDSRVDRNWLTGIIREVDAGADAVAGRIVADPVERSLLHPSAELTYLRQVGYGFLLAELEHLIDPDPFDRFPRHPNHNGASIALTAATYVRIGGLPEVAEEEDSALWRAILRSGARPRHSVAVRVTTSARLDGRVNCGFSAGLKLFKGLERNSPHLLVESAPASEIRLRARRKLRQLKAEIQLTGVLAPSRVGPVAGSLGIAVAWLFKEIHRSQPWGRFVEQVDTRQIFEGEWERSWPKIPLEQAIADLRIRLSALRSSKKSGPDHTFAHDQSLLTGTTRSDRQKKGFLRGRF